LPGNVPSELPPAYISADGVQDGGPERALEEVGNTDGLDVGSKSETNQESKVKPADGDVQELKLPEFPQECKLYVPALHNTGRPHGLLLWFHDGDEASAAEVIQQWRAICDRDGLLLAIPTAAESNRWNRTDLDYLGRLVARIINQFQVDANRIVVYGRGSGGSMAWSLGLSGRQVIRGMAISAEPLPRRMTVPPTEPSQRLAIFAAISGAVEATIPMSQGLQKCSDAGYPVSSITLTSDSGQWTEQEREELARWIDTLDRF
jgi:poly(3-hydroxybutyrate) depolymerase